MYILYSMNLPIRDFSLVTQILRIIRESGGGLLPESIFDTQPGKQ